MNLLVVLEDFSKVFCWPNRLVLDAVVMSAIGSSQLVWLSPKPGLQGFAPEPRCNHTLSLLSHPDSAGSALLWGGRKLDGQHSNELFRLDIGDINIPRPGIWQWSHQPQNPKSPAPEAREGHCAAIFRRTFVIFGGLGTSGLLNDVAALDLENWEWFTPAIIGIPPLRRHQHTGCAIYNQLVIFGGFSQYGDCENGEQNPPRTLYSRSLHSLISCCLVAHAWHSMRTLRPPLVPRLIRSPISRRRRARHAHVAVVHADHHRRAAGAAHGTQRDALRPHRARLRRLRRAGPRPRPPAGATQRTYQRPCVLSSDPRRWGWRG